MVFLVPRLPLAQPINSVATNHIQRRMPDRLYEKRGLVKPSHFVYALIIMSKIAVIETGGKQYVVRENDVLSVEKLGDDMKPSAKIVFDKVLLVDDGKATRVGAPHVSGAKVTGEIVEEGRAKKVNVIRFRSKSRYFKKRGHRQPYSKIRITGIS